MFCEMGHKQQRGEFTFWVKIGYKINKYNQLGQYERFRPYELRATLIHA